MSLLIIKQGIYDTVQDEGRYGLQHAGINPGGAADIIAFYVANMLVGNKQNEAVVEMYYPAPAIFFETDAAIALSGADFGWRLNGQPTRLNSPVIVSAGSVLESTKLLSGCCCNLSVMGGIQAHIWEGSYSTNVKAKAGGYYGRKLQTGDVILCKKPFDYSNLLHGKGFIIPGWYANVWPLYAGQNTIHICEGNEYNSLDEASKSLLENAVFAITPQSDRMGFRLKGLTLQTAHPEELVSTGVTRGTIQLLPSGQLLVLMADHQTTGGYPRIAHVVSADMPRLAQMQPGKEICFSLITVEEAERLLLNQHQYLQQLQIACNLRLDEFLPAYEHY